LEKSAELVQFLSNLGRTIIVSIRQMRCCWDIYSIAQESI